MPTRLPPSTHSERGITFEPRAIDGSHARCGIGKHDSESERACSDKLMVHTPGLLRGDVSPPSYARIDCRIAQYFIVAFSRSLANERIALMIALLGARREKMY